ncbi:MAG TPA: thioredoxin domain-containing protein [Thermoanaerobaculia bacterium]|jgi:protein-disulfide isomerase
MRITNLVAVLALAGTAFAQSPSDVVARVGEHVITRADLVAELPEQYHAQYERVTAELRDTQHQAVRELLGTRTIEATAKQRHVDVEQIYRETLNRELENFPVATQAKLHQIEASIDQADRLTLEESIDRRLYDEAVQRGLTVDQNVAFDDVAYLRAYETARRNRAQSSDPVDQQIAASAAEARAAVLRARMIEAARRVVKVERLLQPPRVRVSTAGFPRLGNPDAPVQLVVFTDYECPYCAENDPVVHELFKRYGNDVSVVMRDYPMAQRKSAMPAAIAARCASEQGKFWEYHDLLFANRTALTSENFRAFAERLGMNVATFDRCVADPITRATIEREVEQARSYGVDATPTYILNGRLIAGVQTLEGFAHLIAEETAKPAAR